MSLTSDQMEMREAEILRHYPAALALLQGFDHAPRIASATSPDRAEERSPGVGGSARRFPKASRLTIQPLLSKAGSTPRHPLGSKASHATTPPLLSKGSRATTSSERTPSCAPLRTCDATPSKRWTSWS